MLAAGELVTKTEILQSLTHFASNLSFTSVNDDSKVISKENPRLDIVFKMVLHKYSKNLLEDLRNSSFFQFDESTSFQILKQYDRYVRYCIISDKVRYCIISDKVTYCIISDKVSGKIVTACCGSLFVGHCTNKQSLKHFEKFGVSLNWSKRLLLLLAMDGLNFNFAFQQNWPTVWVRMAMNSWILEPDCCTMFTIPSRKL